MMTGQIVVEGGILFLEPRVRIVHAPIGEEGGRCHVEAGGTPENSPPEGP